MRFYFRHRFIITNKQRWI